EWIAQFEIFVTVELGQQTALAQVFHGAWVDNEEEGEFGGDLTESINQLLELVVVIDVGWAMQGDHPIVSWRQVKTLPDRHLLGPRAEADDIVDHDIAHHEDFVAIDPLFEELLTASRVGSKEEVGDDVGAEAIDLFRHVAIEAA